MPGTVEKQTIGIGAGAKILGAVLGVALTVITALLGFAWRSVAEAQEQVRATAEAAQAKASAVENRVNAKDVADARVDERLRSVQASLDRIEKALGTRR